MKEILNKIGITEETLRRALRTFIQAAVAYIAVNLAVVDFSSEKTVLKQALIGLAVSALSAGISAVMNLEKPEQFGGTALKFTEWVKMYLGKKTDYDGAYGVQCVDLIDCYIDRCLGLKKGYWGNAKTWWTLRKSSTWLKDNFDFITPTYRNGELKTGDIGIRTSGTYGHIFIVKEPTANGKIKYYDQNATGSGDKMTLREKPYTSATVNGILRPKNQSNLKETASAFKAGSTYTLTTNVNVRTGVGTNYAQKKKSQLTADGQKNALNQTYATLKSGTRFTVQQIKYVGSDIWAQIPSGWICLKYNGKLYAK